MFPLNSLKNTFFIAKTNIKSGKKSSNRRRVLINDTYAHAQTQRQSMYHLMFIQKQNPNYLSRLHILLYIVPMMVFLKYLINGFEEINLNNNQPNG